MVTKILAIFLSVNAIITTKGSKSNPNILLNKKTRNEYFSTSDLLSVIHPKK
jgi:hypothetical protein